MAPNAFGARSGEKGMSLKLGLGESFRTRRVSDFGRMKERAVGTQLEGTEELQIAAAIWCA